MRCNERGTSHCNANRFIVRRERLRSRQRHGPRDGPFAYRQVHEQWKRDSRIPDLRTAAFLTALNKVATTYLELGIFP